MRTNGDVVTVYRGKDKVEVKNPNRTLQTLLNALVELSVGEEDALSSSDPWAEELFEQIEWFQSENTNA